MIGQDLMADRIHAAMYAMQTAGSQPVLNRGLRKAHVQELAIGEYAVLPTREPRDVPIT
jgi:hypothetical protein